MVEKIVDNPPPGNPRGGQNQQKSGPSEPVARALTPGDYNKWNALVAASPSGSIYSTPDYLETLCAVTGGKFKIIAVEKGQEFLGGIALYEEPSRWGVFVSDRRLLYYNGIVLRDYDTKYPSVKTSRHIEILDLLERAISAMPYASLRIKSRAAVADPRLFMDRGWSVSPAFSYVVNIKDMKAAWERVEQNLRRLVDRCGSQGMQFSDDDDFDSFFRMHAQTHDRKGAPIYLPRDKFRQWFEILRSRNLCKLYHARLPDGRSIAAQLVLTGSHPVTHTVSAAADPEFLKMGANAFLRWRSFETLAALGYAGNDLTDATLNPVTHFKSQLGGDLNTSWVLSRPETRMYRFGRWLQAARARK